MDLFGPLKGHRRYHAGVADRLEVHVATIASALEFNHDEVRLAVDGEKIDASAAVLPISKFLGKHVEVIAQLCVRSKRWRSSRSRSFKSVKDVSSSGRKESGVISKSGMVGNWPSCFCYVGSRKH